MMSDINPNGCNVRYTSGKREGKFCIVSKIHKDGMCKSHWDRDQKKKRNAERKAKMDQLREQDIQEVRSGVPMNQPSPYVPTNTLPTSENVPQPANRGDVYSSFANQFRGASVAGEEQRAREMNEMNEERASLIGKLNAVTGGNPGDIEGMTINELKEHLAQVAGTAINETMRERTDLSRNNNAGKALFKVNVVVTQTLEALSVSFKDTNPNVPDLSGITQDIVGQKDEYEEVLQEIYLEYADDIAPLLGPLNRYMLMMGGSIATRAVVNKKNTS